MSKMSRLNLELTEQAYELGFESLQDALQAGYEPLGDKLYLSVEKTREQAREEALSAIDEVLQYLREEIDSEDDDRTIDMKNRLLGVETFIKENF